MEYNIYCDESCHLKSNASTMVIGAVYCPINRIKKINKYLSELKIKYGLDYNDELKWNKIKKSNENLYLDIIKYFFEGEDDIKFRAIVIDKNQVNNEAFHQTEDDFYYKMYYDMLKYIFNPFNKFNIYPDIKDSHSYYRHQQTLIFLRKQQQDTNKRTIQKIQPIKSYESMLLQLADIIIGAISYHYNMVDNDQYKSSSKRKILSEIEKNINLDVTTPYNITKFNLFIWESNYGRFN